MKILTPFLFAAALLAAPSHAQAAERSLDEMRAAAQQALTNNKGFSRARALDEQARDLRLLADAPQTTVFGYDDGGFAIVSNDDRLPAVLAYCEGSYSRAMENPSFANYISTFNAYLDHCAATGEAPRFIQQRAQFNPEGVKEIMKCRWDQGGPYNYMCPFVYKENDKKELDDRRCITGCVATAMAQILYTLHQKHGTDIKLRGGKYYYYIDDAKRLAFEHANFAAIPLDWDNMLDTYSATTGHKQNMAVARLMYACGVAAEMMYSTGASGTYTSTANEGLNDFFEGIKAEYSGYGIEDFEQRIYDEFDAGRAVLLSGADSNNSGHAFVGDGYDKEGRIHINLGWSGGGNGFFTIANMAGFENAQTVNFITPQENDGLVLSKGEPIDELKDQYVSADIAHPAEAIVEGKWYVLYNKGRYSSVYSTGAGKTIQNTHYVPVADATSVVAPMLVRFISSGTSNKYYVQMGTGDYLGALDYGSNYGSDRNPSHAYTVGKIQEKKTQKYFWFKQGSTVLDCNATGSLGIAGWGTSTPTDTLGHSCWMLLPVTFSNTPEVPTMGPNHFDPTHRYILVNYDGTKNYYFNLKATCSIAPKNPTELRLTPSNGGWTISSFEDENLVVSAKSKDFKLGNNSTASEYPLTFSFEPIDEEISTGDEVLDACSKFYRIRCESGYIAPTKIALGGNIYNNLGFHTPLGRWQLIDQTELDEILLEGISEVTTETQAPAAIYDLQGRRVTVPHNGIYIKNGKKTIR